jgi:hypothetical protein
LSSLKLKKMRKIYLILTLAIVAIAVKATVVTFPMKTANSITINTDYTLTNTIADTFVFNAPRTYPATQAYEINIDSTSGDHTNVAVSLYGKIYDTDSWTQIGSTVNWKQYNPDHDTTILIHNTTANTYNYYMVKVLGTGTGVSTIDIQKMKIWSTALSDGVATLSNGSFAGIVNLVGIGDVTMTGGDFTGANGNSIDVGEATDGTIIFSRDDAGAVTLTSADNNANADLIIAAGGTGDLTLGDAESATAIISSASVNVVGAINSAIAGGTNVVSAGLLGGGGTSTSATQTLGAAGGKAFSYYLSSTSTTASDVLTGYYLNMNYGTSGSSAAPSGDAIRGRAYLVGDASGSSAVTGGAFTVELAATTASNTGLTAGMRGNLVLPDGTLTNSGTFYGSMAEVYLGGTSVNTTAYTEIAPLGIVVGGSSPTSADQVANMVAIAIRVPSNMISSDGTMVCTGGAADTCDAKLKISINGTSYWIMLSTDDE